MKQYAVMVEQLVKLKIRNKAQQQEVKHWKDKSNTYSSFWIKCDINAGKAMKEIGQIVTQMKHKAKAFTQLQQQWMRRNEDMIPKDI